MADKEIFKWSDTRRMPVEGSVEITLPDAAFFEPAGSGYVGSESGNQLGDGYPFLLHGAGQVVTLKNSKAGVIRTTKTVTDDTGLVEWCRVDGNTMYFSGHMADNDPTMQRGAIFRGYVYAPDEGSGAGEVTIEYADARGRVTISGWLEHELSGAEITGSNA